MDFIKVSNRSNFNNTDNNKQSSTSLLSQSSSSSSSSSVSSLSSNGNGVGCGSGGGLTSGCSKNLNLKNNNVRNGTNGNNNNNSSSYSTVPSSSLNTTDTSNISNSTATTATATSSSSSSNNINNNSNNKSDGGSVDDPETKNEIAKDQYVECQRNVFQSSEQLINNEFKTASNTKCDEKLLLNLQFKDRNGKNHLNNNLDSGGQDANDEYNDEAEQRKPFLQKENENGRKIIMKKPKSIVKSPSTHSFAKDKIVQKPRLSFNCPLDDDLDRHVQFSHHDHPNGGYSKSDIAHQSCSSPTGSLLSQGSRGSETSSSSSSNDNSSTEQYSEARPPDGGYGWVIVFASFLVNMIADGITFSFGVIFVEFLNYFGEGKAKTAWIGSLFMAMPLLSGPIASFLTDRYGCRKVTIVGSILASTGFVISAFATSTEMLFLTFGVIAGFGLSLCYVAAVVIVAYYFDKRRSFATGLSVCGSGIGTFVFAPLTQILLEEYGWRGTTLIFAGIFLNMCVCGALMRDLEWTTHRAKLKRKNKKLECQASADSFSVSNSTNTGGTNGNLPGTITDENGKSHDSDMLDPDDARLFSSLITLPTFIKSRDKVPPEVLELLSKHRNVHEVLLQNYPGLLQSRSFSEPFSSHNGIPSPENALLTVPLGEQVMANETERLHWMRRRNSHHQKGNRTPTSAYLNDLRMHRHSLTYRGAMLNINRYRLRASSCPDIYRNSMTTIAKEKTAWYQGIDEFKNLFVDILDLSYFTDVRFLLFAISNLLLYTWYDVPYVYLADNAIEMGYSEKDASILISVIGIVNMFGEIYLGWIGDKKSISPSFIYAICMILCGVTVALVPLCNSYWSLIAISGAFGLFIAANYSLTSIILVELITLERFTNAYGLLLLVQGIANLIGPPLAGWVYDMLGSYDLSFYLAGIFISLSGLLLLILPAIERYKKYAAKKQQISVDNTQQVQSQEISVENKSNGTAIFGSKEALADVVKV